MSSRTIDVSLLNRDEINRLLEQGVIFDVEDDFDEELQLQIEIEWSRW